MTLSPSQKATFELWKPWNKDSDHENKGIENDKDIEIGVEIYVGIYFVIYIGS